MDGKMSGIPFDVQSHVLTFLDSKEIGRFACTSREGPALSADAKRAVLNSFADGHDSIFRRSLRQLEQRRPAQPVDRKYRYVMDQTTTSLRRARGLIPAANRRWLDVVVHPERIPLLTYRERDEMANAISTHRAEQVIWLFDLIAGVREEARVFRDELAEDRPRERASAIRDWMRVHAEMLGQISVEEMPAIGPIGFPGFPKEVFHLKSVVRMMHVQQFLAYLMAGPENIELIEAFIQTGTEIDPALTVENATCVVFDEARIRGLRGVVQYLRSHPIYGPIVRLRMVP